MKQLTEERLNELVEFMDGRTKDYQSLAMIQGNEQSRKGAFAHIIWGMLDKGYLKEQENAK